ncbi:hypothetical protein LXL04_011157 [Taraxacum kok-saghyz]
MLLSLQSTEWYCSSEQFMEFKVLMVMLSFLTLSVLLLVNGASLDRHQKQASHDLAQENWFGYNTGMPRKLLNNQKVEGIKDKDLVYNIQALSDESRKGGEQEQRMHEGSDVSTFLFSRDYSGVRKRRPVHNKSFPATTTFP